MLSGRVEKEQELSRLLAQLRNRFETSFSFRTIRKREMMWPIAGANLTSMKRASQ